MLRLVLSLVLGGGAAVATLAPALDAATGRGTAANGTAQTTPAAHPTPSLEDLLLACITSADPDSEICARAHAASGLERADFRARIVEIMNGLRSPSPGPTLGPEPTPKRTPVPTAKATPKRTPAPTAKATPKHTAKPADDFWAVFERCLATRNVTGAVCRRAQTLVGFGDADFRAKFERYLAQKDGADAATSFKKCVATRNLRSEQCVTARRLSGLTEDAFHAKLQAALEGDFWYWFERCLDTRSVASVDCAKARALIGFSDADFKAKFERYLAQHGPPTPKPAAAPTPTP